MAEPAPPARHGVDLTHLTLAAPGALLGVPRKVEARRAGCIALHDCRTRA